MEREANTNKYDYGHVVIIGGAPGMVGAPLLSAMSALRVGAGLVTIASSPPVIDKLEKRILEIMTIRLDDNIEETLLNFINDRRVSSVVFGPGFDDTFVKPMKAVLSHLTIPVVLDAGAITAFQGDLATLRVITKKNKKIVLTPHDGEYRKLTGDTLPIESYKRQQAIQAFAKIYGVTIVGKGNNSIVASPHKIYVNNTGNPGMATAGTGDVLDGMIAGLLADGLSPYEATQKAVYLHGLAGDIAAEEKTQDSLIASDLIEAIPKAQKELAKRCFPPQ